MNRTRPPYQRRLTFEIRHLQAEEALRDLENALRMNSDDAALDEAIRTQTRIRALYRAWEGLDVNERNEATMTAVRSRGHLILSAHSEMLARPVVRDSNGDVVEQASAIALFAVLWKVANALDDVEDASAA